MNVHICGGLPLQAKCGIAAGRSEKWKNSSVQEQHLLTADHLVNVFLLLVDSLRERGLRYARDQPCEPILKPDNKHLLNS